MVDFPTVEGGYRIAADWEIVLPGEFQRRFEGDALVLWRPGLTARVAVSVDDDDAPKEVRLRRIQEGRSGRTFDVMTETNGAVIRYGYRSEDGSGAAPAFHCVVVGNSGHVQMAVSFDSEAELETAQKMWRGLREVDNCPAGGCGG
jgi:hypothetical protein